METKKESEVKVVAETVVETAENAEVAAVEPEVKRISTKEIIAYLAEKFPACFSTDGHAKPLKIGIF